MRNFFFPAGSIATSKRVRKFVVILAVAFCVTVQSTFVAVAQAPADPSVAPVAAAPVPVAQPDAQRTMTIILVKNALLAVNQGNLTGNYTVLRDLASPGLASHQSTSRPADQGDVFAQRVRLAGLAGRRAHATAACSIPSR